ncbi:MAG: hypothetical protein WCK53_04410 [Methanomicrobiales archaeon]
MEILHTDPGEIERNVDPGVRKLIHAILHLKEQFEDNIMPFSSCGGHTGPTKATQCKEGEFYVEIAINPVPLGFIALGIIAHAAGRMDPVNISIGARSHDEQEPYRLLNLTFTLTGKNNTDPDKLAGVIEEVLAEYFDSLIKKKT